MSDRDDPTLGLQGKKRILQGPFGLNEGHRGSQRAGYDEKRD